MDILEKIEEEECLFQWNGKDPTHPVHTCKHAPQHSGLHGCAYCGVVYVTKRAGITFSALISDEPGFKPKRDDDVTRWLKAWRDKFTSGNPGDRESRLVGDIINDMLDDYREHADTGTPLDATIERDRM